MQGKVVLIFGPTGVKKSITAIQLSKSFGEIISADSMQIYQGLNIGTAKLNLHEREGVAHHLIDILQPDEYYNAYFFQKDAHNLIKAIHQRKKVPFIVGGTGLYFKALVEGLFSGPGRNTQLRDTLTHLARDNAQALYEKLQQVDPTAALKIHPSDTKRIIRALEVYQGTNKPLSVFWQEKQSPPPYRFLKIALTRNRKQLYTDLNQRCIRMIHQGLLDEVQAFHKQGYTLETPSMKAIGYRHFLKYFQGQTSYQDAHEEFQRDSRRFAKRQWTFFKSFQDAQWFDAENYPAIEKTVTEFLHAS